MNDEEDCPNDSDGHGHCTCWWDGGECCRCGDGPMPIIDKLAQGMDIQPVTLKSVKAEFSMTPEQHVRLDELFKARDGSDDEYHLLNDNALNAAVPSLLDFTFGDHLGDVIFFECEFDKLDRALHELRALFDVAKAEEGGPHGQ